METKSVTREVTRDAIHSLQVTPYLFQQDPAVPSNSLGLLPAILPQMSETELRAWVAQAWAQHGAYAYGPGVYVRGTYHWYHLRRHGKPERLLLTHAGTFRITATCDRSVGYGSPLVYNGPDAAPAVDYAAVHWGDHLVLDDWVEVYDILVARAGLPEPPWWKCTIGLTTKLAELRQENDEPFSELIDDHISGLTTCPVAGGEVGGTRPGIVYCHCGAARVVLKSQPQPQCWYCREPFTVTPRLAVPCMGLPRRVIYEFGAMGVAFSNDPAAARAIEHLDWARQFYRAQPAEIGDYGKSQRVVELGDGVF